jgi:hypothetical protein
MDSFYNALINAGGLGLLAGVLFYLHVKTLAMHREEYRLSAAEFKAQMNELSKAFRDEINIVRDRADARSEKMSHLLAESIATQAMIRTEQLNRIEAKLERQWSKA